MPYSLPLVRIQIQCPPSYCHHHPGLPQDNQLTLLPHQFFPHLPLLTWLDLRMNKLTYLPPLQGHSRSP